MTQHCKIGKVTFKDTKISALHVEQSDERLRKAIGMLTECWEGTDGVSGFFIVTWDKECGFYRCGLISDEGGVPITLLPSWLAEVARRWIIEDTAKDVIGGKI